MESGWDKYFSVFFFPPVSAQWEDKGDCSSTLLLSHYISTCRDPSVGKNVLRCHLNGPDIYETLLASCARAEKISKICWLTNSTSVWPGKLSNLFCFSSSNEAVDIHSWPR